MKILKINNKKLKLEESTIVSIKINRCEYCDRKTENNTIFVRLHIMHIRNLCGKCSQAYEVEKELIELTIDELFMLRALMEE